MRIPCKHKSRKAQFCGPLKQATVRSPKFNYKTNLIHYQPKFHYQRLGLCKAFGDKITNFSAEVYGKYGDLLWCVALRLTSYVFLLCRAEALLHRGWAGDAMFALADCEAALRLDPDLESAHVQRVFALKGIQDWQVTPHMHVV